MMKKKPRTATVALFLLFGVLTFGFDKIVDLFYSGTTPIQRIVDGSGNKYTFVTIGTQDWLSQNLKTTRYNDGTDIPLVEHNTAWQSLTTPGYCWYNNDQATYGETYGALYNWYTINTGKLCPIGWHVPTYSEWTELIDYLAANGYSGTEGDALKATSGWNNNGNGTDDFGFTALPGGNRYRSGTFYYMGNMGTWWSTYEFSTDTAWYQRMSYYNSNVSKYGLNKKVGLSVRCVRD